MATLIATAKATNANSYATLTESNSYMETVRPSDEVTWLKESEPTRERLLMLATRIIDNHFVFIGIKKDTSQSLQWPRSNVPVDGFFAGYVRSLDSETVPQFVKDATSQLALELVSKDVLSSADGEGLESVSVGDINVNFDKEDRNSTGAIPNSVYSILRKYGYYKPSLNSTNTSINQVKVVR